MNPHVMPEGSSHEPAESVKGHDEQLRELIVGLSADVLAHVSRGTGGAGAAGASSDPGAGDSSGEEEPPARP